MLRLTQDVQVMRTGGSCEEPADLYGWKPQAWFKDGVGAADCA